MCDDSVQQLLRSLRMETRQGGEKDCKPEGKVINEQGKDKEQKALHDRGVGVGVGG